MKTKFNDFLNESTENNYLNFEQIKNTIPSYDSYANLIRAMGKKEYKNTDSVILKAVVNTSHPQKILNHFLKLKILLGNNNRVFNGIVAPIINKLLLYTKFEDDQKKEWDKYKKEILNILSIADNNSLSVGNIKGSNYENIMKFLCAYSYYIFSDKNMDKIFRLIHELNLDGWIAEKSMKKFLEIKGETILPDDTYKDIHQGIDVTTKINTFQVKASHNSFIQGNKLTLNRTRADILKVISKSQRYGWLAFMGHKQITIMKRIDIVYVEPFKKGNNRGFKITIDKNSDFRTLPHITDYKERTTGTILDEIFKVI